MAANGVDTEQAFDSSVAMYSDVHLKVAECIAKERKVLLVSSDFLAAY